MCHFVFILLCFIQPKNAVPDDSRQELAEQQTVESEQSEGPSGNENFVSVADPAYGYSDPRKQDAKFFAVMTRHSDTYTRDDVYPLLAWDLPPDDPYYRTVVKHLKTALTKHENDQQRAVEYLNDSNIPNELLVTLLPELTALVSAENAQVYFQTVRLLERLGKPAATAEEELSKVIRFAAPERGEAACRVLPVITAADQKVAELLLEIAGRKDTSYYLRRGAYAGLARLGREDVLIKAFDSGDESLSRLAAVSAAHLPSHSEAIVRRLLKQANAQYEETRQSSIPGLAAVKPMTPRIEAVLARFLKEPSAIKLSMGQQFRNGPKALQQVILATERAEQKYAYKTLVRTLSHFSGFEEEVFQTLCRHVNRRDGWPENDDFFRRIASHLLNIAEDKQRSPYERAIALHALRTCDDEHDRVMNHVQRRRHRKLTDTLFDRNNPLDLRLSTLLEDKGDWQHRQELYAAAGSAAEFRKLLIRGMTESKLGFLREACLFRSQWDARDLTAAEYQPVVDAMVPIAANPDDPQSHTALYRLKDHPELSGAAAPLIAARIQDYDVNDQELAIEVLGVVAASPDVSMAALQECLTRGKNELDCLTAMARIVAAHNLDPTSVITGLRQKMQKGKWYYYDDLKKILVPLGPRAEPLVTDLTVFLKQIEELDNSILLDFAEGLAAIGPSARETALVALEQIDQVYDGSRGRFVRDLVMAGLGKEALSPLVKSLELDYGYTEAFEAFGLAREGAAGFVPVIMEHLTGDNESRAAQAAMSLAAMGEPGRKAAGAKIRRMAQQPGDYSTQYAVALIVMFPNSRKDVAQGLNMLSYFPSEEQARFVRYLGDNLPTVQALAAGLLRAGAVDAVPDCLVTRQASHLEQTNSVRPQIQIITATFGTAKKKADATASVQKIVDAKTNAVRINAKGLGIENPAPNGRNRKLIVEYTVNGKELKKTFKATSKRNVKLWLELLPPGVGEVGPAEEMINKAETTSESETTFLPNVGINAVKQAGDTVFQLGSYVTISRPAVGFEWKLQSEDPVVYACVKGDSIVMTLSVLPPRKGEDVQFRSLENFQKRIGNELKAADVDFEFGYPDTTYLGDDMLPNTRGVSFDYMQNGEELNHTTMWAFRNENSYRFTIIAPSEESRLLYSALRYATIEPPSNLQPISDDIKTALNAKLDDLREIFDIKTKDDVATMIKHVFGSGRLNAMKTSGQFDQAAEFIIKETSPQILATLNNADWSRASLSSNGSILRFRVPPVGLTFVRVENQWKLRLE